MQRCRSLCLLALLLLPCFAHAGDSLQVTAGAFRRDCLELRECSFWQSTCDVLLSQVENVPDEDVIEVDAENCWRDLQRALIEWRVEQKKSPQQKNRERVARILEAVDYARNSQVAIFENGEWSAFRSDLVTQAKVFLEQLREIK